MEPDNITDQDNIARLLFGQISKQFTHEQRAKLQTWLSEKSENKLLYEKVMKQSWCQKIEQQDAWRKRNADTWKVILFRTQHKSRIGLIAILKYAAVLLTPIAIIWMLTQHTNPAVVPQSNPNLPILILGDGSQIPLSDETSSKSIKKISSIPTFVSSQAINYYENSLKADIHRINVPRGYKYRIILADGSVISLRSESTITYPNTFGVKERRIKIEGECFCEIKSDSTRPFILEVDDLQLTVLGTTFDVRAYKEESEILTTLVSGRLQVSSRNDTHILKPGEQSAFHKKNNILIVEPVDVNEYISWINQRIVFNNQPLSYILSELQRYYNVNFFITKSEYNDIPFSLNVKQNENIDTILFFIEETSEIRFEKKENVILVK